MPIRFVFDLKKTVQAIGVLMRADGVGQMSCMRLLKLLYFADREGLKHTGRPITGDLVYAMKDGPVLSRTYSLMKQTHAPDADWDDALETVGYDLRMVSLLGVEKLSPFEVELLQDLAKEHRHRSQWELRDYAHEHFAEFRKHDPRRHGKSKRERIPVEDIIRSVGRQADITSIARDAEADEVAARLLG